MSYEDLLLAAKSAAENAYAPYSGFRVGAAVMTDNGRSYIGCNVENAAYPEGLCAEASALAAMAVDGARQVSSVVVYGADANKPLTPCGGCRQKLAEFCDPETEIVCVAASGETCVFTLTELLPAAFSLPVKS